MKSQPRIHVVVLSSVRWLMGGLMIATLTSGHAASGQLDESFNPPPDLFRFTTRVSLVDRHLYFAESLKPPVRRLREDGSLDADWSLKAPIQNPILDVVGTPAGGWVIRQTFGVYVEQADHSFTRINTPALPATSGQIFPQDDGSLVFDGLWKFRPDGSPDPAFSRANKLLSAPFDDGAVRSIFGSIASRAVQDRQGRFVVVGNFRQVGSVERLGLARFSREGQLDLTWNPGPAAGIRLNESNSLTRLPDAVILGPDDALLIRLYLVSTNGQPNLRFVTITDAGEVTAEFPNFGFSGDPDPVVQPDGRVIVGGRFNQWGMTPATGLIRLEPDGSVDSSFVVQLGGSSPEVSALALDESGRLWLNGWFDTVHGIARTNIARIFAYDPPRAAPQLSASFIRTQIATNEILQLTAEVGGYPPPQLQWYRGDEAIPGATHRGLRLSVGAETPLGEFRLVAWNDDGTNQIVFPEVSLAIRSPKSGGFDPSFDIPLPDFPPVAQLAPMPDGRVVVAAGYNYLDESRHPMVGRLDVGGAPDPSFGDGGFVMGNGVVENLTLLPGGGMLVAGRFTELAGSPAAGLAELDASGRRLERAFPAADSAHISAALRLSDGRYILAGAFTRLGETPAFRLGRLDAQLRPDPTFTSPLASWEFVDELAIDRRGRLLIAGYRLASEGPLTNPVYAGVQRLREDGSADPAFQRLTSAVRGVVVEPDNTLVVGMPPLRLSEDGQVLTIFDVPSAWTWRWRAFQPDHRLVRMPDGGVLHPMEGNLLGGMQLMRWWSNGLRDETFEAILSENRIGPNVEAAAVMPDGSVWVALRANAAMVSRLRRILPDPDLSWANPRVVNGKFHAEIPTQSGRSYAAQYRDQLNVGAAELVEEVTGDGYWAEITLPADGASRFLELRRE